MLLAARRESDAGCHDDRAPQCSHAVADEIVHRDNTVPLRTSGHGEVGAGQAVLSQNALPNHFWPHRTTRQEWALEHRLSHQFA